MNRRTGIILFACLTAALLGGCKSDQPASAQGWFDKMMHPTAPSDMVRMAFDPSDADHRREGVTLLSNEPWGLKEPYLDGYSKMVRSDEDVQVRCAAVRALGKARAFKYLPVLVQAMSDDAPDVRWCIAVAVDAIVGAYRYDPNVQMASASMQKAAMQDASPDVRGYAVKALRNYRDRESVKAAIQCLYDEAFSVRYLAHLSLVEMSDGKDLGYDPAAWTKLADGKPVNVPTAAARPWWDWGGVTQEDAPVDIAPYNTVSRPWWDWTGSTEKDSSPPKTTTQPSGNDKPWWDWAGVTAQKPSADATTQAASQPASAPAAKK